MVLLTFIFVVDVVIVFFTGYKTDVVLVVVIIAEFGLDVDVVFEFVTGIMTGDDVVVFASGFMTVVELVIMFLSELVPVFDVVVVLITGFVDVVEVFDSFTVVDVVVVVI